MKYFLKYFHLPRDGAGLELGDDDAEADTEGAGEAEDREVRVEDELLSSVLLQLQAHTEDDDKLVESDGWKGKICKELPGNESESYR